MIAKLGKVLQAPGNFTGRRGGSPAGSLETPDNRPIMQGVSRQQL
jgi:hypothetical protein